MENLSEILDRVVFAADWQRKRSQRHGQDAEAIRRRDGDYGAEADWLTPETLARWEGTEIGAEDARRDNADTLHSVAVALAKVLGTEVPDAEEAKTRVFARSTRRIREESIA